MGGHAVTTSDQGRSQFMGKRRSLARFGAVVVAFCAIATACVTPPEDGGPAPTRPCYSFNEVLGAGDAVFALSAGGEFALIATYTGDEWTDTVTLSRLDTKDLTQQKVTEFTVDADVSHLVISADGDRYMLRGYFDVVTPEPTGDVVRLGMVGSDEVQQIPVEGTVIFDSDLDRMLTGNLAEWGAETPVVHTRTGAESTLNLTAPDGVSFRSMSPSFDRAIWQSWSSQTMTTTVAVTDTASGAEIARVTDLPISQTYPATTLIDDSHLLLSDTRPHGHPGDATPRNDYTIWNFETGELSFLDIGDAATGVYWTASTGEPRFIRKGDFRSPELWYHSDGSEQRVGILPGWGFRISDDGKRVLWSQDGIVSMRCF